MLPERNIFIEELKQLNNEDLQQRILDIYDHEVFFREYENPRTSAIAVLKELFNPYGLNKDTQIPLSFILESNIGIVIFQAINKGEILYSIAEILELTKTDAKPEGLTKSLVSKDINNGNIKGIQKGKSYYFPSTEVKRYLNSKGIKI